MASGAESAGRPNRKPAECLLWDELVAVAKGYVANPFDQELEEYFAAACLQKIKIIVKAYVYWKGLADIFVEEGVSLAQEKITRWMRGKRNLDNPDAFRGWLIKLARHATIQAWLKWIGRGKEPPIFVSLEEKKDQPIDIHTVIERRQTLRKLLKLHAERGTKRDKECVLWIVARIDEDLPVAEIARRRRTTQADVHHLFKHDENALKLLYWEQPPQTANE